MAHPLEPVLENDPRYPVEAYEFVREALAYAQEVMGMGEAEVVDREDEEAQMERHLTGQELCEASRRYALEQYGMMAHVVLKQWGIHSTSDLGEVVYNLIRVDLMRKSSADRREDFDDVYDFQKAFNDDFDFAKEQQKQEDAGSA